jgi:hypothetical protein
MAITAPIPLPGPPGEAFFQGAANTQNILTKILEGRQNAQKLAQTALANQQLNDYRMKELAQTATANSQLNNYRMGSLAISKLAESRQQQLMPYLEQEYKDKHEGKISENAVAAMKAAIDKHTFDQVMGTNQLNQSQPTVDETVQRGTAGNAQAAPSANLNNSPILPGTAAPNVPGPAAGQVSGMPGMGTNQNPLQLQQSQIPGPLSLQDIIQPLMSRNGMNAPNQANATPNGTVAQPEINSQAQPQAGQISKEAEIPQETILNPGDKSKEFLNKLAGTSFGPKLEYHYGKNGGVYTKYPNGKITYIAGPQSAAGAIPEGSTGDKVLDRQLRILREKEGMKVSDTADTLIPYMYEVQKLQGILKKKPDLTGRLTQAAKFIGATTDPDVGTFSSGALKLQTNLAKDLSSRGGYGVARIVSANKPDIANSGQFNMGALKDLKTNMVPTFLQLKAKYEETHPGKQFKYKLENIFPELEIEAPSGKIYRLPTKGAVKLLEEHPDHRVVG